MRIAITGASGLIGSALATSLRTDGHDVLALVRRTPRDTSEALWDPARGTVDVDRLRGVDAVVHLAGAGVGDRRWNARYKAELMGSRILGTNTIAQACIDAGIPVLVSGSAIGLYGDAGDTELTETSERGPGFLADVVEAWEAAAQPAVDAGIRVAFIRTGLVASKHGGAFGKLLPIFRLGLGGPLGDGREWWSAISMEDQVRAIGFLIEQPLHGAFNLTAPEPVRNKEFSRLLGRALGRPALLPVPAPALRLVVGGFASEILASQRVLPVRLLEAGFSFHHPNAASITQTLR